MQADRQTGRQPDSQTETDRETDRVREADRQTGQNGTLDNHTTDDHSDNGNNHDNSPTQPAQPAGAHRATDRQTGHNGQHSTNTLPTTATNMTTATSTTCWCTIGWGKLAPELERAIYWKTLSIFPRLSKNVTNTDTHAYVGPAEHAASTQKERRTHR